VDAYLNSGVPLPSEYYYQYGRAYPDVAAFGQNVQVGFCRLFFSF
jgi:hypothetical protein